VIINAPMSYAGSAQRISRLRRRARNDQQLVAITVLVIALVVVVWTFVTVWYLLWGFALVPYRLLRRGARKRKAEALRHRELLDAIHGSPAPSAGGMPELHPPGERIADADREHAIEELREDLFAGRLSALDFENRVGAVHSAATWADLAAVRADLPHPPALGPDGAARAVR
jgi:hypothetical protein